MALGFQPSGLLVSGCVADLPKSRPPFQGLKSEVRDEGFGLIGFVDYGRGAFGAWKRV